MNIIFMGTPGFAVSSLTALLQAGHHVSAVFTRADKPVGRGMRLKQPPVKVEALSKNIPVYQPKTLRDGQSLGILKGMQPDLIVVAAYGRVLTPEILELPRYGCINVHASLLPKYRGASPIQSAILNGEEETGVTIMQMGEGIDTGDMLLRRATPIGTAETYGQLHDRLAGLGADLLVEAVDGIADGTLQPEPQDESLATHCTVIHSADARLTFADSCSRVSCLIRGFDPKPGAFCNLGEDVVKLYRAWALPLESGQPGEILHCDKKGLVVACGQGAVCIEEVQGAGGKRMSADAFFRGHQKLLAERFA